MNKIKKYKCFSITIIFIACILSMPGCTKFLTHNDPAGVTDTEWWNTEQDARNALKIIYDYIPGGTRGQIKIMYLSALSDEAVSQKGDYDKFVKNLQDDRWDLARSVWAGYFLSIRRANRYIKHVDHCFMDKQLRKRMKFEARALRAFYSMQLLLLYGDIPIVNRVVNADENMSRDSADKVYKFVLSELKICADSLPLTYDNVDNWRISSGACEALISRLALYFHNYTTSRDAAKRVIDSRKYKLYKSSDPNTNSYAELFSYSGELNPERILFSRSGCSNAWTTLAPFGIGGQTFISPTASVVNNYETKQGKTIQELGPDSMKIYETHPNYHNNRDPRMEASVFSPGDVFNGNYVLDPFTNSSDKIGGQASTLTGYWVRKYIDQKDQQRKSGTLDFMIIRYSEVLLNYVEDLVELGDWQNPDVVNYLNEIRERAGMPDINTVEYDTQEKMRQLVRRERESELAFEGQRYFDIRRWGIADQVMNGTVYGATNPQTNQKVVVEDRKYNSNRGGLWPIPQDEILANPNIKQNPGYSN